jgi:hypothetical protein
MTEEEIRASERARIRNRLRRLARDANGVTIYLRDIPALLAEEEQQQ